MFSVNDWKMSVNEDGYWVEYHILDEHVNFKGFYYYYWLR